MLTNNSQITTRHLRGERISALAELEGCSITAIAKKIRTSQPHLSRIINGDLDFPTRVAESLALTFCLPLSFFEAPELPQDKAATTFRKKSTTRILTDRKVSRVFSEGSRLWRETSEKSGYKTCDLTEKTAGSQTAEEAALSLREAMGISGDSPIRSVTRLAEHCGVGVIDVLLSQSVGEDEYSGISRPSTHEHRPLIACVNSRPGAVQRMTLAHELGHLIFDHDLLTHPKVRSVEERRAFAFAGALLLPEEMMIREVDEGTTLNQFLRIKARYGVSVGAIVVRAERLGLISSMRSRSLHIQLNSRGWQQNEPVLVRAEKPGLLGQAFSRAWGGSVDAASRATGVPSPLIRGWLHEEGRHDGAADNVVAFSSRRRSGYAAK